MKAMRLFHAVGRLLALLGWLTVSSFPGGNVQAGEPVTFTASVPHGNDSPTRWATAPETT